MRKYLIKFLIGFCMIFLISTNVCKASSGKVYTVNVNRSYRHPITGIIEDSGGEASYEIGQGMVEGAVHTVGILEKTDNDELYLTIEMSLFDYTSGHTVWVQNNADDVWYQPEAEITGHGSDSNGATGNITIKIPHEDCILKGGMYVEAMGRDVIWYMTISNITEGNSTHLSPIYINEESGNPVEDNNKSNDKIQEDTNDIEENIQKEDKNSIEGEKTEKEGDKNPEKNKAKSNKNDDKKAVSGEKDEYVKDSKKSTLKQVKIDEEKGLSLSTEKQNDDKENSNNKIENTKNNNNGSKSKMFFIGFIGFASLLIIVFLFMKFLGGNNERQ